MVELMLDVRNELGEGPMWDAESQMFYWVDILGDCFYSYDPATGSQERYDIGQPVGTVVLRQQGGFVLALRDGLALWDTTTRTLEFVAQPHGENGGLRFNDGAVDRQGRFWAGTMRMGENDLIGTLYRLDPDHTLHAMQPGVSVSNGLGWSPDNTIMYFCDSGPRTIYKYDFDAATGAIENRRVFVEIPDGEGSPDGLTVDSEGFIWSARWDGWKIVRFDPDGKAEREIPIPAQRVTSCVFGGPDLDQLYITSARIGVDVAGQPHAGGVFRLDAGVKGLAEPKFGG